MKPIDKNILKKIVFDELEYFSREKEKDFVFDKNYQDECYHFLLTFNVDNGIADDIPIKLVERFLKKQVIYENPIRLSKYIGNDRKRFYFIEEIADELMKYISPKEIFANYKLGDVVVLPNPMENTEYMTFSYLENFLLESKSKLNYIAFSKTRHSDDFFILKDMAQDIASNINIGLSIDTDSSLEYISDYEGYDFAIIDLDSLFVEYDLKKETDKINLILEEVREAHQHLRIRRIPHYIKIRSFTDNIRKKLHTKGMDNIITKK